MNTIGYEAETASSSRDSRLQAIFQAAMKRAFTAYRVEMTAADATSGVRGRRHICLVSSAGLVLVVGTADPASKTGELRTLGAALGASKDQLGHELPIPPGEYLSFLTRARQILDDFGLAVTLVTAK